MMLAAVLLGYAVLLGAGGGWLLRQAGWLRRSPRLALLLWQASCLSAVLAALFAGLVLAAPTAGLADGLAGLLRSCVMAIGQAYASPGGAAAAVGGLLLAVAVGGRVAGCTLSELYGAGVGRRRHRQALRLVGRRDPELDAVVVTDPVASAYCLPGRHGRVVISSAALDALTPSQLAAVMAHERAHLGGHHHLVVAGACSLHRAFPHVPLFAAARTEIPTLVEMMADDRAATSGQRLEVAAALLALAGMRTPAPALAASAGDTAARVRRLLTPSKPLGIIARGLGLALAAVLLTAPVAVAAAPAAQVANMPNCPLATHPQSMP